MSLFSLPSSSLPFLQNLTTAGVVRSKLVSMAAGHVLANYAPLAPQESKYYAGFFNDLFIKETLAFCDAVHSVAPADIEKIQNYARSFYEIRCKIALGCCAPSVTGSNGVYNLYHLGENLSCEDLTILKSGGSVFAGYCAGFEHILKSIMENCKKDI